MRPAARLRPLLVAAALALAAAPVAATAAGCPRPGTLGTARVLPIEVGPGGLFVGTKSYPQTLPLAPHEIVLTFDDGPAGATTDAVLAALAAECVRATFFVVGEMAAQHPDQLKRIAAAGHTIGHHSMRHPILTGLSFEAGRADIEAGWRTVDRVLTGTTPERPTTPFFRYPGFAATRPIDDLLIQRRIAVFGADFWGSDWNRSTPEALLKLTLERIEARGSGILLLHDTHAHTAAMVPMLLRELRSRGWSVVQVVPSDAAAAAGGAP